MAGGRCSYLRTGQRAFCFWDKRRTKREGRVKLRVEWVNLEKVVVGWVWSGGRGGSGRVGGAIMPETQVATFCR